MEFINLKYQYQLYQREIDEALRCVLKSGHFILGPHVEKLERSLASYVGVKHCIGVSSGTDGLLLALKALDLEEGDEVICTPFTWVSPIECIERVGARAIFVDIDPRSYLIDVDKIEAAITPRTKALIVVSLYGQMPDFIKINQLAIKYNLTVIEDGAQSFGASQRGNLSGCHTTIGVTSFFPTKPLGCYGDGGAVFTNREDLAEKINALRVHGASERYNHQHVGINGRLDELQAAILLAKLPYFDQELQMRRKVAAYYSEHLHQVFQIPHTLPYNTHSFALYVLRSENRKEIVSLLEQQQVPVGLYYPLCVHQQPAYAHLGFPEGSLPHAEKAAREVFSLPMHPFLKKEELDQVIGTLKQTLLQKV